MSSHSFINHKRLNRIVTTVIFILFFIIAVDCYFSLSAYSKSNRTKLFESRICTSRGECNATELKSAPENCTCVCKQEFYSIRPTEKFNGIDVQCTVPRKSKFVALFLCVFIPIGSHFLYLENYIMFGISITLCFISIFGNCARFTMFNSNEVSYFRNKWNLVFAAIGLIMIFLFTMSFIFIVLDIETDGNNELMYDDLNQTFSSLFKSNN